MKIRTFIGAIPLFVELDFNHWREAEPNITVIEIHYQDTGQRCSLVVEYAEADDSKFTQGEFVYD